MHSRMGPGGGLFPPDPLGEDLVAKMIRGTLCYNMVRGAFCCKNVWKDMLLQKKSGGYFAAKMVKRILCCKSV